MSLLTRLHRRLLHLIVSPTTQAERHRLLLLRTMVTIHPNRLRLIRERAEAISRLPPLRPQ